MPALLQLPQLDAGERTRASAKGAKQPSAAGGESLRRSLAAELTLVLGQLAAPNARPLTVGVLGGSISQGEYVAVGQAYTELLHTSSSASNGKGVHILNRAIPATGCSMASFCFDELLPPSDELDAVVIEYAVNDGHFQRWHTESILNGASGGREPMSPLASMERLVRHVRLTRPRTTPLILYMCDPLSTEACDGLYSPVARAYGLRELSLARALGNESTSVHWQMSHPDATGHVAAALTVARALLGLVAAVPPTARPELPAARYLPNWESNRRWRCKTCDWLGCERFQPVTSRSYGGRFAVQTWRSKGARVPPSIGGVKAAAVSKAGWAADVPGGEIAFPVPEARARVLVAFLCSYESVGEAEVTFTPVNSTLAMLAARRWLRVTLRWSQQSSQQCIFNAGETTGPSNVHVRVAASSTAGAQVKVFGVYSQHT